MMKLKTNINCIKRKKKKERMGNEITIE
jgi:hypothetical protein